MTTSDVKIGNLFRERISGKIVEVIGITVGTITFSGNFKGQWQADPIHINNFWLHKLGFYKNGDLFYRGECILKRQILDGVDGFLFCIDSKPLKRICFLHELHNICYELQIDLKTIGADEFNKKV